MIWMREILLTTQVYDRVPVSGKRMGEGVKDVGKDARNEVGVLRTLVQYLTVPRSSTLRR